MSDRRGLLAATWLAFGLAMALPLAYAQYPGRIDTSKKGPLTPRAIAVVEWTGAPGKPNASRMIPISVFDGGMYQPGGLYLARPEPLAVEPGTEYILQRAGLPQGLFDVNGAQDVEGYWFGYGARRQIPAPPKAHKLQPAKIMPHVIGAGDDDGRPHFANHKSASQAGSSGNSQDAGGNTKSGGEPSSTPAPPADQDPDRPVLRRRSATDSSNDTSGDSSSGTASNAASSPRETAIGGPDPDRPHLDYGKAEPADEDVEPPKLTGTPPDLEQVIAVSDATDREPHSFAYSWPDPDAAAKMQAQMEALAQKALAPPPPAPAAKRPAPSSRRTAAARRRKTASPAKPLPELTGESFEAYELTYGGGVTLVFSAESTDAVSSKVKYVTLIAQPDFSGVPHVIFKSVTDNDDLDLTPRMRLVDAVDTKADNRGDLIFELRGKRDRQFVIYQIAEGQAEQVFTTGPLPLSTMHGS